MTIDIPQNTPDIPDEVYDASDLGQALKVLPPDLQQSVTEALRAASHERKNAHKILQLQTSIAEFATALHLLMANDGSQKYTADLINWDLSASDIAGAIITDFSPELEDKMPDSVRKAVAYFFAGSEFIRLTTREEVDRVLEPFGYPTSRILDDLVAERVAKGGANSENTPERIREEYDEVLEQIRLQDDFPELERKMREELLALGYKLPELEKDNSYGHSEDGDENYPDITTGMLPG